MCAPTLTSPIMYASCSETEHGSTHVSDGAARSLGYPPLSTVDALFERRLGRRRPAPGGGSEGAAEAPFDDPAPALPAPSASGAGSEGPSRPPSKVQRRPRRRHLGGGSEGGRSPLRGGSRRYRCEEADAAARR